jgi:DNA-binding SARP family transcriptional activator/tetratricopeptide (TPR) repeat protein
MRSIELRLLGTLELRRDGRIVALPRSKKTRALLAYLAATGRPHSRASLCELLWDGPDDPRGALRWSLAKIRPLARGTHTSLLVTDGEDVAMDPSGVDIDLAAIRANLGADPAAAAMDVLRRSADRFRGEFLEGLDLPDCYRYHEWWTAERESIRALRVSVLSTLVRRLAGDPDAALACARARLLVDPFAEDAHISVIELLAASGRTREALQQYESCRRMLEGQLGARPSSALERARSALGAGRTAERDARVPALVRAEPTRTTPLVGRAVEHARIALAVDAAVAGNSRDVLWITGEPGIGKTRLLEEAAALVREANGIVLAGRAYEAEMVRPYGPWIDALRQAAPSVGAHAPGADVTLLLPELGADASPGGDRQRLFDAVANLVAALTTDRRPAALILDDVQWLDEASAGLLHFVARSLRGSRVLVICAARSAELSDNAPTACVLRALRRDGHLDDLPIERLSASAIRELAKGIDARVDVDRVFAESEGNPLFAIEIVHALGRGGSPLSDTVEALIIDRLSQIDEHARALLPWAAALGRSFNPETLRIVSGLAPSELVAAMEDLERRGIIRASPSTPATYDFTHDLIRQAAYRQLSDPRRRIVHLQLARALSGISDPESALAGEIAHHAALGGDHERAARAAIAAGERSLRMFAYAEAHALAERGMRGLDALPRDTRIRLHMALLNVAVHASLVVPGARDLDAEVSRVTLDAQQAGLGPEVASGFHLLSFRHHRDGKYDAAHDDTLRAAEAGRREDHATAARTLGTTGRCLALIEREIPRAESMLVEAQALAAGAGIELIDIHWGLGLVRAFAGEYDEAIGSLETAVTLARREHDHWAECGGLQRLALIEFERGCPDAARSRARELALVAAKMGEGSEAPFAEMLDALSRLALGEGDANERVEAALGVLRRLDAKALLSRALTLAATADVNHGELERAGARAEEALTAAEIVGRRSEVVMALALLVWVGRRRGHTPAGYQQSLATALTDPHAVAWYVRQAADEISSNAPSNASSHDASID